MPYWIQNPGFNNETLQVFEAHYHHHNARPGFWGPVQSSIDWCERNYVVTEYVAEWYNTISNIFLICLSLAGLVHVLKSRLELRFVVLQAACLAVGLGSALFHGTLTHLGQQGDETPLVWALSTWLYCLWLMDPEYERRNPVESIIVRRGLISLNFLFAVAHYHARFVASFQIVFAVLSFASAKLVYSNIKQCRGQPLAQFLGGLFILGNIAAFVLWLVDQHHCEAMHNLPFGIPNPQLHAWWHAISGVSCYAGPAFLTYRRLSLLGRDPTFEWTRGMPFAVSRRSTYSKKSLLE